MLLEYGLGSFGSNQALLQAKQPRGNFMSARANLWVTESLPFVPDVAFRATERTRKTPKLRRFEGDARLRRFLQFATNHMHNEYVWKYIEADRRRAVYNAKSSRGAADSQNSPREWYCPRVRSAKGRHRKNKITVRLQYSARRYVLAFRIKESSGEEL